MSGAAVAGLITGQSTLIVGVEPDRFVKSCVRVYVGARYLRQFFYVTGEDADRALRAWNGHGGHLTVSVDACQPLIEEACFPHHQEDS